MSTPQHYPSPNNDQGTMMLMALALILIAIVIFHSIFYYACCAMLYYLWYLADFASIHTYVAGKINLLAWVEDLSLGEFLEVMNQTAGMITVIAWFVYQTIALTQSEGLCFRYAFLERVQQFSRTNQTSDTALAVDDVRISE